MRMTLSEAIVLLMEEPSYRSMTMDEISRIFGKTKLEREEVKKNIFELSKIGKIVIDSKRRCDLPERKGFLRGILSVNAKGYGFITREEGDVFIAPPDTAYAMNGDEVLYKITKSAVDGLRAEGYVYSIIRRNTDIIVGQFSKSKSFGFVIPDDNRIGYDIFIPKKLFNQAKHGDIVSCQILKYPEKGKKPEGMILGVIGRQRSLWVDIESELIQRKIAGEFPPRVSKRSIGSKRRSHPGSEKKEKLFKEWYTRLMERMLKTWMMRSPFRALKGAMSWGFTLRMSAIMYRKTPLSIRKHWREGARSILPIESFRCCPRSSQTIYAL